MPAHVQHPYDLRRKVKEECGSSDLHHPLHNSAPATSASCQPVHAIPASVKRKSRRNCSLCGPDEGSHAAHYLLHELPDEVILSIFSHLFELDLCRVAQVCKRFQAIASDCELWKTLYQDIFEYDLPLVMKDGMRFEFMQPEEFDCPNPWRQSLKQHYPGSHIRPGYRGRYVKQSDRLRGRNITFFDTIEQAVTFSAIAAKNKPVERGSSSMIFLHTGSYRPEGLVISSDISFIGAAAGNVAESVIIEQDTLTTVSFVDGAKHAYLGYVTVKFSPENSTIHQKHYCLEICDNSSPTIEHCTIRSSSAVGAAVCVAGAEAEPTIRFCDISNCENVGLYVTDHARGIYEELEISRNALAGVWVKNFANPIMRRNHIHHGRDVGVFTFDNGQGYFESNNIHNNRIAGFEVKAGANPTVVRCEIHRGQTGGIYVHENGRGQFIENRIHSNNFAGVWITSHSNPTIRRNEIFNGLQGMYQSVSCFVLMANLFALLRWCLHLWRRQRTD